MSRPASYTSSHTASRAAAVLALLPLALLGGPARAQTMLDQEERLVELHSLLMALPAAQAPGALAPWQASAGVEVIAIPVIDGTTGGKVQITASDRTRAFPRLRAALGLPLARGFRASAGAGWIPPVEVNGVTCSLGAVEGAVAWLHGPLSLGLRGQAVRAVARSPVTDPRTRDVLRTTVLGGELSAGWGLDAGPLRLTPYASAGAASVDGRFRVTSDGADVTSTSTRTSLGLGLRAGWRDLEAVGELVAWPGRLTTFVVKAAWTPSLAAAQ